MPPCKMHNVRFYNPEPQGIRCMAFQEATKKLAISRIDASIEIWNLSSTWFLESCIPSTTENFSIEGLSWCKNRLFSVGLHGFLIEYDLYKLSIENSWVVTGEAAFCLDVNRQANAIAIGTEQGYLNIFKVEDDVLFDKFFDKQEGRIICLKFDSSGQFIASGSMDVIRIWNVETGHAIHKMTTGRSEANKPTVVWCLEITNDFTIITGDSRGKLTVWDGKMGAQIESYQSHKADILAVCLCQNQMSLFCAGVDPSITNYEKINVKGGNHKWVKSIQRKIHEHDVNALIICDNKLYSGGADGYLACSYYPPKTLLKLPPLLQPSSVQLASQARYLMLRYSKHVEIWSIGRSSNSMSSYRGLLTLQEEPKKLIVLQRTTKDYEGEPEREGVICSCISHNGRWILYSTSLGTRLFRIRKENNIPSLMKMDFKYSKTPCLQALFTVDNSQLITCPNYGGLLVYDLLDSEVSLKQKIETTEITDTIAFLLMSPCGKYLIAADISSNIVVWSLKTANWSYYCKLPKYGFPPTAMAIQPRTLYFVVAYSDNKIIEYDLRKQHLTDFSNSLKKINTKSRSYPIRNILFDPRVDHIIILHDDSSIIIINKEMRPNWVKSKFPKFHTKSAPRNLAQGDISIIKKYKHLMYLDWLGGDEMVVVEVNPLTLLEQLPPAFVQHTFGRK